MRYGDSNNFAIELNWIDSGYIDCAPEEAATWAEIKIIVNNQVITKNNPTTDNTVKDYINWHVFSLAEWVTDNWEKILYESKPPIPENALNGIHLLTNIGRKISEMRGKRADDIAEKRRLWWASHSIRSARKGGAFPEVIFWPQGNNISIAWQPDQQPFAKANTSFMFIKSGHTTVTLAELTKTFLDFLSGVRDRLRQKQVNTSNVQSLCDRINNLINPDDIAYFKVLKAYLGLNNTALACAFGINFKELSQYVGDKDKHQELINILRDELGIDNISQVKKYESIPDSIPCALFRCVAPDISKEDVKEIKKIWKKARESESNPTKLDGLRKKCLAESRKLDAPLHIRGEEYARTVRKLLRLSLHERIEIEKVVENLLDKKVENCFLEDRSIDAVSLWEKDYKPAIFINRNALMGSTKWGKRMALAHELCHLIYDMQEGKSVGIASGSWAPTCIERVANAFAAELLLPASVLYKKLREDFEIKDFFQLLKNYKVGVTTASHRLLNLGIITAKTSDDLINKHASKGL